MKFKDQDIDKEMFISLFDDYQPSISNIFSSNKKETEFVKWVDEILSKKNTLEKIEPKNLNLLIESLSNFYYKDFFKITNQYLDYLISSNKAYLIKVNDGYGAKDEYRIYRDMYDSSYFYDNFLNKQLIRKDKLNDILDDEIG